MIYRFYHNPQKILIRDIEKILTCKEKRSPQDKICRIKKLVNCRKRMTPISVVGQKVEDSLQIAVSKCSKKDSFNRKRGRTIAEERLKKGKLFGVYPLTLKPADWSTRDAFVEIAKEISKSLILKSHTITANK